MKNKSLNLSLLHQLKGRNNYLKEISEQEFSITLTIPGLNTNLETTAIQEALLACLCYIDGCGNWRYGEGNGSKRNFIKVLMELGKNEIFSAIHPKMLLDYGNKPRLKNTLRPIFNKINNFLKEIANKNQFYKRDEFLKILYKANILSKNKVEEFIEILDFGTYAAIAYEYMRCPSVHEFGATTVSFQSTTFGDVSAPALTFDLFHKSLANIIDTLIEEEMNLKDSK